MPLRSRRARRARRTPHLRLRGVLVVAVLAAIVVVAWQRPNPFSDERTVRAVFADVTNLRDDSEVRVAGARAGTVTGRRQVAGGAVEVTMRLEHDVPVLRRDATARIRPRLAFEGSAYVDLSPGSARQAALGDAPIPRSHTGRSVPFQDVLNMADRPTREHLRGLAAGGGRGLDRPATDSVHEAFGRLPTVLTDGRAAATALRGPGSVALERSIRGLAATSGAVADREDDLAPTLRAATGTVDALRVLDGAPLREAVSQLPSTLDRVREGSADLRSTVRRLDRTATSLRPALRDATPTLERARPVLGRAGPSLDAAVPLARDLRGTLDRATDATPATRRFMAAATPTLGRLDTSLVPALERPTSLGPPAITMFLNLFAGGGGASAPYQRAGDGGGLQMGTGHFMRFGFRFLTGLGLPAPPCTLLQQASPQLATSLSSVGLCTP